MNKKYEKIATGIDIKPKGLKSKVVKVAKELDEITSQAKKYALQKIILDLENNLITQEEFLKKKKGLGL